MAFSCLFLVLWVPLQCLKSDILNGFPVGAIAIHSEFHTAILFLGHFSSSCWRKSLHCSLNKKLYSTFHILREPQTRHSFLIKDTGLCLILLSQLLAATLMLLSKMYEFMSSNPLSSINAACLSSRFLTFHSECVQVLCLCLYV